MDSRAPNIDRPRVRPDVVSATRDKLMVLLDLETAQYYQLNAMAARIWTLLCDELSIDDIVSDLANRYEAPSTTIREDVVRLVDRMREAGLVAC
jgi:hypothetical protein